MKRLLTRFVHDTSGAVLVEFALILPLLLLLLFGSITWSYSMSLNDAMFDAARQGARALSVGSATEAQAQGAALAVLVDWPVTFTATAEDTGSTGTEDVRVVVSTDNPMATLFAFVPLPATVRAEVVMRKETP